MVMPQSVIWGCESSFLPFLVLSFGSLNVTVSERAWKCPHRFIRLDDGELLPDLYRERLCTPSQPINLQDSEKQRVLNGSSVLSK